MKKLILLIAIISISTTVFAQNKIRASILRSDTIDITHTIISIDSIDYAGKTLTANAQINFKSKLNNIQTLVLDLDSLIVDSVFENGITSSFIYTNNEIQITLQNALQTGDSSSVKIFYHGAPKTDAQWGGFYFNGNYAFNLGVGFVAQPHVFGRAWFPCFDNFNERCSFEFYITTTNDKMAVCNGWLIDSFTSNNNIIWHWKLDEQIPSYLACMAVSNYVFVKQNLNSISGIIPAWIACVPTDTNKVIGSFAHLQLSFEMLEKHFGTYSWPKVGYSLVPFSAGAMEHATNISIGAPYINGNLQYETLIAHELSHHWFGDLATCASAQDMWLNEGFASYCELLHTEYVYGNDAYKTAYRLNHFNVLNTAHINDAGYRAVANMDSNYTYGTTVYNKGEDMLHTLRSYMGDTLFFDGLKNYVNNHKFQNVSTATLQNSLTTSSGKNMSYFFNDWILQAGFPNFTIDSTQSNFDGNNYHINVFVRQRKHKNNFYATHIPLPISVYKSDFTHQTFIVEMNGQCGAYTLQLPYNPAFICLDEDDALSDASTFQTSIIKNTGTINYTQAKAKAKINSIVNTNDSTLLRLEMHWVAPDRFKIPYQNYVLNDVRYWKVDGLNLTNINGNLIFNYNALSSNSYQDSTWLKNSEDSIKLFYRIDARYDWTPVDDSLITGSKTDKQGNIYTKNIIAGEYAFAIKRSGFVDTLQTDKPTVACTIAEAITDFNLNQNYFNIFPNPNNGEFVIQFQEKNNQKYIIEIYSIDGKLMQENSIISNSSSITINTNNLPKGIYFIKIVNKNNSTSIKKLIIE